MFIKNTQILSIPETIVSFHNLWLGGHGGTGVKSGVFLCQVFKKKKKKWPV